MSVLSDATDTIDAKTNEEAANGKDRRARGFRLQRNGQKRKQRDNKENERKKELQKESNGKETEPNKAKIF
jgi:hypothetical protein